MFPTYPAAPHPERSHWLGWMPKPSGTPSHRERSAGEGQEPCAAPRPAGKGPGDRGIHGPGLPDSSGLVSVVAFSNGLQADPLGPSSHSERLVTAPGGS